MFKFQFKIGWPRSQEPSYDASLLLRFFILLIHSEAAIEL